MMGDGLGSHKYINKRDSVTHAQAYSDYKYLCENGSPHDFCGVCCNCDLLESLLSKEKTIIEALIHLIKCYWEMGYDKEGTDYIVLNEWLNKDKRCLRIKERYKII